ncbi:MAG: hypothetical protein NVSMB14_11660 [Isosphaeraceae bacterium]
MSALISYVNLPSTVLAAGVAKTVLQVKAPANQRVKVLSVGLYFDGVVASAVPCQVQIMRQATVATGTVASPTPIEPELTETIQTTALSNATVEPTYGPILETITIPTFMGQYEVVAAQGQEIIIGGGQWLGIVCSAPAAVNVRGFMKIEE